MFLLTIALVTGHPGPANHFAEFSKALDDQKIPHQIIVTPQVSSKFNQPVIECDPTNLELVKSAVANASCVITDVSLKAWADLHAWLADNRPGVMRACYYDNTESFVPGGYSEIAEKVICQAQRVLFANANLPQKGLCSKENRPIDLADKDLEGIGYYPTTEVEKLIALRHDEASVIRTLSSIPGSPEKIFVYLGGANSAYYDSAFPHFLALLRETFAKRPQLFENTLILLQQHPRAKTEGDKDIKQMKEALASVSVPQGFQMLRSPLPTLEGLSVADGVLTFQTSMAPQLPLAGIPLIAQVAKEPYRDILIQSGYPSISEAEEFIAFVEGKAHQGSQEKVEELLGIRENWREFLIEALNP